MFDKLKEYGLIGLGGTFLAAEKVGEKIDQLVEQGKLSVQEGKELTEELIQEKKEASEKEGAERMQELIDELGLVQKEELTALEERVAALEEKLEEPSEQAE